MTRTTAPTTIADYREAYREATGHECRPLGYYSGGWFRFGPNTTGYREHDILAMTDRLRAEKARREGQEHG